MSFNNVILALGVEIQYSTDPAGASPAWANAGQLSGIDGLSEEVAMFDSTGLKAIAEQVPTLYKAGDFGFNVFFDPANTSHVAIRAAMKAKTLLYWRMKFPDPVGPDAEAPEDPLGFQWAGYPNKHGLTGFENQNGIEAAIGVGITGDITEL